MVRATKGPRGGSNNPRVDQIKRDNPFFMRTYPTNHVDSVRECLEIGPDPLYI